MPRRSPEALLWLLFSAGGVASALLIPVLLLLLGIVLPLGLLGAPPDHAHVFAVLTHPLTRLVLLGLSVLALLHFAHRFRYTLVDGLKLKRVARLIGILCYGVAVAGSALAAYVLLAI